MNLNPIRAATYQIKTRLNIPHLLRGIFLPSSNLAAGKENEAANHTLFCLSSVSRDKMPQQSAGQIRIAHGTMDPPP